MISDQPPHRDLKVSDLHVRDLTLTELQLTPSSILLLRFEDEALNSASIDFSKNVVFNAIVQGPTSLHL